MEYKKEIQYGLKTTKELLRRLKHPEKDVKIIHVAGTNGKGSVCSYLSYILQNAAYKVGRYLSPCVYDEREKIQIYDASGCHYITKKAFAAHLEKLQEVVRGMREDGFSLPSVFEIETVLAFLYFKEEKCDFAIVEAGLGGAKDATNAISESFCSVITAISIDHSNLLGDTVEEIAAEKAGIIRKSIPTIVSDQGEEIVQIIKEKCEKEQSPFYQADQNEIKKVRFLEAGTEFDYKQRKGLKIRLLGVHQLQNVSTALEVVDYLIQAGYPICEEAVQTGLKKTSWRGRMELYHVKPYIVIDGAHNVSAAMNLQRSLDIYFKEKKKVYIIGILKDKDYKGILKIMGGKAERIVTFTPNVERGLRSDIAAKEAKRYCEQVIDAKELKQALEKGLRDLGKEDLLVIFGSLSFLGELDQLLKERGMVGGYDDR